MTLTYFRTADRRDGQVVPNPVVLDRRTHRIYKWCPNTGEWHRNKPLEEDFDTPFIPDLRFEEITPAEAVEMVLANARIHERSLGWLVQERRAQPLKERRTHAELGLVVPGTKMGSRDEAVMERLHHTADWVPVKAYNANQTAAAKALASDIRNGRRKAMAELGPLEARTTKTKTGIVVEARRASAA